MSGSLWTAIGAIIKLLWKLMQKFFASFKVSSQNINYKISMTKISTEQNINFQYYTENIEKVIRCHFSGCA